MLLISIDPGNVQSAWVLMDKETHKPIKFRIEDNISLLDTLTHLVGFANKPLCVIEMVACYGMSVGKTVFDTCVWIGRIQQFLLTLGCQVEFVYRQDEKMVLCNSMKAKDSNIRQALIDKYGVVGTKKKQGWFYGFKSDIWAAYAVGVTYLIKNNQKL